MACSDGFFVVVYLFFGCVRRTALIDASAVDRFFMVVTRCDELPARTHGCGDQCVPL